MKPIWQYLWNWLYLGDLALNTLCAGDPRQTLSARMGRDIEAGRCMACKRLCWVLGLIQRDHCARAWEDDRRPFNPDKQIAGD